MVLATTCGGCRDSWAEVRDVGAPELKRHLRLETEEAAARRIQPKAIVGGARAEEGSVVRGGATICVWRGGGGGLWNLRCGSG